MDKTNNLVKSIFVLGIGTILSRMMIFILLPLYTLYLSPSEYGTYDLVVSYVMSLAPLLTIQLEWSAFRYLIDARGDEKEKGRVISNITILIIGLSFAYLLLSYLLNIFVRAPYFEFILCLSFSVIFSSVSLQFARGLGDNKKFAIAGVFNGVTTLFTAPTSYRLLSAHGPALRQSALRQCVSAGEALPAATRAQWNAATGIELIDGIGATELLHIFISADEAHARPGATGTVVPGYLAQVQDDQGREVPPGTVGRLAVKGPTGCRYLGDERQTTYVKNGWNLTGDAYLMDADGYFFYQARTDDMIVSAGYNVASPEVEEALMLHPAVAECAVIGVPDDERGQVITAFVVPQAGVEADDALVKTLQDFVKSAIAPYKYPRVIRFSDTLPRTQTGKLQRFRLHDLI